MKHLPMARQIKNRGGIGNRGCSFLVKNPMIAAAKLRALREIYTLARSGAP